MINSTVNFLWLLGFPDLLTHTINILCANECGINYNDRIRKVLIQPCKLNYSATLMKAAHN